MPNWCENELIVRGKQEKIDKLVDFMKSEDNEFDFNKIVPYPTKYKQLDLIAKVYEEEHPNDFKGRPKNGYNQGGYEWCNDNWGTKWNACDVILKDNKYYFNTAWSPPEPVIKKLSEKFPDLTLTLKYWEGGCGFRGMCKFKYGEKIGYSNHRYSGHRGG